MHGVGADVATATFDLDLDDHQVVDMLKVVADRFLCESGITSADDQIPGGTSTNFACNMTW